MEFMSNIEQAYECMMRRHNELQSMLDEDSYAFLQGKPSLDSIDRASIQNELRGLRISIKTLKSYVSAIEIEIEEGGDVAQAYGQASWGE